MWSTVAFVAGIVLTGLLWQPWNAKEINARSPMEFTVRLPESAAIPIGFSPIEISPDSKFLSFVIQSGLQAKLMLRPADRQVLEPVLGADISLSAQTYYSAFSPDGQWIAFAPGSFVRKSSVFGGAAVNVCDIPGGAIRGLWWAEDHHMYFGHISNGIFRVDENGGTPVQITTLDSSAGEISHRFPELLPDGKSVLYTIKFNTISTFDEAAIAVYDMKSRTKKVLLRGGTYARYVPTGHIVYARTNFLYAVPFDLSKLEITGPPKQLFYGGWMNPFSGDASFAFSRDGTFLYVPRGVEAYSVNRIKWIDMRGSFSSLVDTTNSYFSAALSPDGEKVALHVQEANDDVWLYHIGRKSLTRLTFGDGNNGFPVWTPDSRYVIYSSEHGHAPNIYRKVWDGSGKEERLTTTTHAQYPRSVSPDGKVLALIQDGDIWLLPLDGKGNAAPFFESPALEGNPVFSPNGHYLAYETDESGKNEVVIVPFPSRNGKWQISSAGGSNPIWSPSGNEMYFTQGSTVFAVSIRSESPFDYSAPRKILDLPSDGALLAGISTDGRKFSVITLPSKDLSTSEYTVVTDWFQELKSTFSAK